MTTVKKTHNKRKTPKVQYKTIVKLREIFVIYTTDERFIPFLYIDLLKWITKGSEPDLNMGKRYELPVHRNRKLSDP